MNWLSRAWFPLAVVALVVLAIPGLGLFGLHVAGMETDVNKWLEEKYRLSFNVSLPLWAAWILLTLPIWLILLYFLKLRRKPISVPSTFLWKKSIEDLHVNTLFQWLRRNILLLLQLLAVLGLIYAVLAPKFFAPAGEGLRYVILVDNSASMSATDVKPNRLEMAKDAALKAIDDSGDSDAGMVIVFNSSAEIRQSFTSNKQMLKQAVHSITPTSRPTRLEEALALAESLANPTRSTEDVAVRPEGATRTSVQNEGVKTAVHLFSDGRFADATDFAVGNLQIQFHVIGQPGPEVDNVGIVAFNASRDEYDPSRLLIYARLNNFRNKPARVKMEVNVFIDGKLEKAYDRVVELGKRVIAMSPESKDAPSVIVKDEPGEATLTFEVPDLDDRQEIVVRGRLINHADAFPADDEAFLVVGVIRKARVLIIGPPNSVIDAFFNDPATKAVVDSSRLTKEELGDRNKYLNPAQEGQYDLIIFDCCGPAREEEMPQANTLFIGYPPPPWKPAGQPQPQGKTVEKIDQPAIKGWTNQHGLLKYLTGLQEVGLFEALRIGGLPPRTPKLMEGDRDLLLLFTLNRGPNTDAVLTFSILNDQGDWNTNWPMLPSFPLFWRNVVYTLGNIRDAAAEENVQPGQVKVLRPGPGVDKVRVAPPTGGAITMDRQSRADFPFAQTDLSGVYSATWNGGGRRFAVNLLDPLESNIQPRDSIQLGAVTISAGSEDKRPKELWKWLVLATLVAVLLEWYVYNRRVFV
ncbi:MAG: VWA domain-containing protein [Gemmataceae bacterium]